MRAVRPLASEPASYVAQYLTTEEAATYLRFANAYGLYNAMRHGVTNSRGELIPVCRRGRTLLFDRAALDAWLHVTTVVRGEADRTSTVRAFTKGER